MHSVKRLDAVTFRDTTLSRKHHEEACRSRKELGTLEGTGDTLLMVLLICGANKHVPRRHRLYFGGLLDASPKHCLKL